MKKTVAALLFVASVFAQENLPDPVPVKSQPPAPAPAPVPELKAEPKVMLREEPAPPPPSALGSREAADALKEAELEQVVALLRENYIRPDALTDAALARAGVQGLLDRLGAGARIFPQAVSSPVPACPFRSEVLEGGVAYLRLGTLGPENLAALDKALDDFTPRPAALVLDLRATPPSTDFELAAEVCRRFAPRGRILFSIKRPKVNDEEILTSREDPRWSGLLVVLVDGDTAGSAEIVAAVLRTHLRAYVVGQQTRGEAAQFEDIPLGGERFLRVAIGEVTLPDATPVFPGGLTPDLALAIPQERTDAVLAAALDAGAASLVTEKARPRMSEAALVAGLNPELDAMKLLQEQRARGEEPKPALRDTALQRALDYITSVGIFEAARRR